MSSMRVVGNPGLSPHCPCGRCSAIGCHWDRLADHPVCPDCQVELLRGESEPLILRRERRSCAICEQLGTIRYTTFPLHESEPIEIDLCPAHLRDLMARRLTPRAYQRLRRQLNLLGLAVEQIFLLHESFYDESGSALRPMPELL
jgi:hypothetical protein